MTEATPTGAAGGESDGLRLGLSSGLLYPAPTEAAPEFAARHGFRDLEVMLQTLSEYEAPFVRRLRDRCAAAGVRVYAVHLWQQFHPLFSSYRRRVEDGYALFDRGIAVAAELGASVLVWHGPTRAEAPAPDRWEPIVAVIAERGRACAAAGLTLGIENVSWCALASVREVAALAARLPALRAGGARVGFTYDPFQAAEAGANPIMVLAAMGDAVVNVHLSDYRGGDARHLPPGEGDLPWPALLRAIAGAYAGPMMIEGAGGDPARAIAAARATLEPLPARVGADDDPCAGEPPSGVLEGLRLFNRREFYEAHEAIEPEWHAERRPVRRLYQGVLQIAVGFMHALRGNHRGALLLLADGIEKTSGFLPACLGLDTARLVTESRICLEELRRLGPERLRELTVEAMPFVHRVSGERPGLEERRPAGPAEPGAEERA